MTAASDAIKSNVLPKVSVIIVTYNSTQELPGCIESVLRQTPHMEVFLVDNASPDSTPEMVTDYGARFDNIFPILNTENIGLAAGNNCPIGKCKGDYVLILNPDTVLRDDTLERMVNLLDENPDIGVLGPKSLYEDGTAHVSFFHHWGFLQIWFWRILPYQMSRVLCDRFTSYNRQDVLFVSGACLLIRRTIFEQIGGYDSEYFLTVEDVVDLCIRARKTGCRIVFSPEAEIIHFTGRSGTEVPYISIWQGNRGTVYHFLKHKGIFQALLVSFLLIVFSATRAVVEGILGAVNVRYRKAAKLYTRVSWDLIARNPIWTKT